MITSFFSSKKLSRFNGSSRFKLFSTLETDSFNLERQIQIEKRKRNQGYFALDYLLDRTTYFDFFSPDTFEIAKASTYFALYFKVPQVTPELLLYSCFYKDSSISTFLKPYSTLETKEKIEKAIVGKISENKNSLENEKRVVEFSRQVNQIFLKTAELGLNRFKNPVITSEMLLLTLMEESSYSTYKLIKKVIGNEADWYVLRYQLIKHLHSQESNIRSEISKNQQYFAYLLKTQITETEFDKLLETKSLERAILMFRNLLISESLKMNVSNIILKEIKKSIKITNTRKYSSEL
jgi:hypothetical protein